MFRIGQSRCDVLIDLKNAGAVDSDQFLGGSVQVQVFVVLENDVDVLLLVHWLVPV